MKKLILTMMTAAVLTAAAMPVTAQVFTTEDGVMSIETPEEENWAVTPDPKVWFTVTDGSNIVSIDHLSNGENLPSVVLANDDYEGILQTFISTKNEVFVIKAMAGKKDDVQKLIGIVNTIKILKYDTKTAISANAPVQVSDFGLRIVGEDMYVTANSLNVRTGCSTDDAVIGEIGFGEKVQVNGAVTKNNEDFGWYQIQYKGGTGYVSASFLSDTKPEAKTASTEKTAAPEVSFTVYDVRGSEQGKLTKKDDGYYYSNDGQPYKDNGDGSYYGVNTGDTLYNYVLSDYDTATADRARSFMVWDGNGNAQGYLAPSTRGDFYLSNDGQPYVYNGEGSYYGTNTGDYLYDYQKVTYTPPVTGFYHELSEVTTGNYAYVTADYEDSYVWVDSEGTEYQNNGDGTFTDYYGNEYNMID